MKKLCLLLALTLSLLSLTGCGRERAILSEYEDFSKRLSNAETLSFTAQVRAEYEHKTARFTLEYSESGGAGAVTVTAPALIAGIRAQVERNGTKLEYGDVSLDTGDLNDQGLSPMSSLPLLIKALRSVSPESCWQEDGKNVVQLLVDDDLICTVWFGSAGLPLRAEILSDGRVTVYMDIENFKL